jgi:DNA-binding MarR family transcriptional regulator
MRTIAERQDAVNPGEPSDGASVEAERQRTPAGDAFSAFAIGVLQLHGQLSAAGDALARPAGQSSARWQVLAGAEHGRYTVADVARILGLARQSVQRVADLLESEGLIAYADNPRHRRARLLVLTPAGREALTMIQAAQAEWANTLGAELGARRLQQATAVLEAALRTLAARRHPERSAAGR